MPAAFTKKVEIVSSHPYCDDLQPPCEWRAPDECYDQGYHNHGYHNADDHNQGNDYSDNINFHNYYPHAELALSARVPH